MLQKVFVGVIFVHHMFSTNIQGFKHLEADWDKNPFDTQLYEDVLDPDLCQQQLTYLTTDATLLFRFLDAGIRTPRGIFTGNIVDLGNFHQCLAINEEVEDMAIRGKYCRILIPVEDYLHLSNKLDRSFMKFNSSQLQIDMETRRHMDAIDRQRRALNLVPIVDDMGERTGPDSPLAHVTFNLAICIPRPCTTEQAINELLFNLNDVGLVLHDVYCRLPDDRPWATADYVASVVFCTIGFLTVISTCYDIYQSIYLKKDPGEVNSAYTSFSVYTNTRRLLTFNSGPGTLECLDGVRALSMIWVILGHSFTTLSKITNPIESFDWTVSARATWVTAAPFAVDTFFFLSGLLLVYTTVGRLKRMQLIQRLPLFYLNRLLRMFPILAAVILFEASFIMRVSDGPLWNAVAFETTLCRNFWWTALLHVQNYTNPELMCIPVSWYLAIDIQLHILSPIVLFWVLSSKQSAWTALTTALLVTLTASTVFIFFRNLPSGFLFPNRPEDGADYFKYFYVNTLTRASPLLVGMVYGYLLHHRRKNNVQVPKIFGTILLLISLSIILVVLYCGYIAMGLYWDNQLADNFFNSFLRSSWALALGWIIFSCVQGTAEPINWFLSLQMWKLPARISYAMYLVHSTVMIVFYSSIVRPMHFSVAYVFFNFVGFLMSTMILSFFVTLLIDSPFSTLFKLLIEKGFKKSDITTVKTYENNPTRARDSSFVAEENNKNL